MAAAASPLAQFDGFYYAPNGTKLNFALSSAHGYLTNWSVTYGSSSVALTPSAPTQSPTFSISVAPGVLGPAQPLNVTYDALAGGPGQEDVATLSLILPAGKSVVISRDVPDDGYDFTLYIAAN